MSTARMTADPAVNHTSSHNHPADRTRNTASADWLTARRHIARRSRLYHTDACLRSYLISMAIFMSIYLVAVLIVWAVTGYSARLNNTDYWPVSFFVITALLPYAFFTAGVSSIWQFRAFTSSGLSRRSCFGCTLAADAVFCFVTSVFTCLVSKLINVASGGQVQFVLEMPQDWAQGIAYTGPKGCGFADMCFQPFGDNLSVGQFLLAVIILTLMLLATAETGRALFTVMSRLGRVGRWVFLAVLLAAITGGWLLFAATNHADQLQDAIETINGITYPTKTGAAHLDAGTLCLTLTITTLLFWGISVLVLRTWEERPGERE